MHATPLGASRLAGSVGGSSAMRARRPVGTLAFPIEMDEIQADVSHVLESAHTEYSHDSRAHARLSTCMLRRPHTL